MCARWLAAGSDGSVKGVAGMTPVPVSRVKPWPAFFIPLFLFAFTAYLYQDT